MHKYLKDKYQFLSVGTASGFYFLLSDFLYFQFPALLFFGHGAYRLGPLWGASQCLLT